MAEFQAAVHTELPDESRDWLFKIITDMSAEEKAMFLLFVTGSSAVPASGFANMSRPITIVGSRRGPDALPVSHTCFNVLEMPEYSSQDMMKERLLYAIRNSGAVDFGFV